MLYATNTLHVRCRGVDPNPLVDYVPALYLASVTSLEWVIKPEGGRKENFGAGGHLAFFRALPTAMPNLQRLYIGFWECGHFWADFREYRTAASEEKDLVYTEQILGPLDLVVGSGLADGLKEMEIGLPWTPFRAHFQTGVAQKLEFEAEWWASELPSMGYTGRWGQRPRIWRPVSREKGHVNGRRGYWLGETQYDVPWDGVVHCFGR